VLSAETSPITRQSSATAPAAKTVKFGAGRAKFAIWRSFCLIIYFEKIFKGKKLIINRKIGYCQTTQRRTGTRMTRIERIFTVHFKNCFEKSAIIDLIRVIRVPFLRC
jgi:hypothetical protein